MMDMHELGATLKHISQYKGNQLKAVLKPYLNDHAFREVCKAAYDPAITYGLKVKDRPKAGNDLPDWETFKTLLDRLSSRELTGNEAKRLVNAMLAVITQEAGDVLVGILHKDLRAGFTDTMLNELEPGFIFTFDVMLSHKFEEKRIKSWPQIVEPKIDGMRATGLIKPSGSAFYTRSGKLIPSMQSLANRLQAKLIELIGTGHVVCEGFMLDGEATAGNFYESVSELRNGSLQASNAIFTVFHSCPLHEFENTLMGKPYLNMREDLEWILKLIAQPDVVAGQRYFANSFDEIYAIYNSIRAEGGEGVMVKDPNGKYEKKRSYNWLKVKSEETVDLRVIGCFEGEGKYVGKLGGLIVNFKGVPVRVGGGFTDQQREAWWLPEWQAVWGSSEIALRRIAEIEYHETTPDGSLRHPRFVRLRDTIAPGFKE